MQIGIKEESSDRNNDLIILYSFQLYNTNYNIGIREHRSLKDKGQFQTVDEGMRIC